MAAPLGGILPLAGQQVCSNGIFLPYGFRSAGNPREYLCPSCFLEKQSFVDLLNWFKEQLEQGSSVLGGDFNLIANLGEKKGGQGILDKYQDALSEFISQILMVDVEIGSGWFTWNNKHGGEHPMAS